MKRKNQEGAIVVEATIALTTFMFLIVTILSIVNICLVQARMGTLVHGIAKDISNYTYIYTMAGLNEKEQAIKEKADYARNGVDKVVENSNEAISALQTIGEVAMDGEFWRSMTSLLVEGAIQEVKGQVLDDVCKLAAEKRLASVGEDANAYLVRMGIEEGIAGLDFSDSELCSGGGDDIKIIVTYKVHVLELLGIDFDFNFEQCAYTKAWCAATGTTVEGGDESSEEGGSSNGAETDNSKDTSEQESEIEEENKEEAENTETESVETKSLDEYVEDATHNNSAEQVMLGKATGNEETDYVSLAKLYDMTYFELSEEDQNVLEEQGSNAVWSVHKKYLEEQEFAGKSFMLSSNPYHATGIYYQEVDWLINKGYTFEYDPGIGLWKAVRE